MKKQQKTPDVLLAIKSFFTMVIELFFDPKMSSEKFEHCQRRYPLLSACDQRYLIHLTE